ncbi:hypothetical protein K8R04_02595 [Candidatus Uhrbacteria bacterium]|nr:hypothetical protein [Candidatus Uhrbacteria bacterium]
MTQGALVVLKVSCVMAGDNIPASLCETEQGGTLCSGCRASTRRCTACNQANGIADARRGLCGSCLAVNRVDTSERRTNAQRLEDASSGMLDLIDQMDEEVTASELPVVENASPMTRSDAVHAYAEELLKRIKRAKLDERSTDILHSVFGLKKYDGNPRTYDDIGEAYGVSRQRIEQLLRAALLKSGLDRKEVLEQLKIPVHSSNGMRFSSGASGSRTNTKQPLERVLDPEIALQVLAEHGVIKPNGQYVPNPARVLGMRIGLLPSEAQTTVEALLASGKIERADGDSWRFLIDISDVIRNRDENFTWRGKPTRALAQPASASGTATVLEKSHTTVKRGHGGNVNSQAVYSALLESAQTVDGNIIVRGAIPVLLARLRVRPHEAIEILEQLQTSGNVRQVDEWRSICLLGAPALPAQEAAAPAMPELRPSAVAPVKTRRDPFTGTPVRHVGSHRPKLQPLLPTATLASIPTQPPAVASPVKTEPRVESKVKVPKAPTGPTLGELFDAICRLSTDLGGERLVRAVVPTLSARLSIGIPDIIAAMERLELQKAILRKDGWRTIVVVADRVEDTSPVRTIAPSVRERAEKLNLRVVDGGGPTSVEKPKASTPTQQPRMHPPVSTAPDRSVSEELSQLRRTVEELNRTVAALAVSSQVKSESAPEPKAEKQPSEGLPKLPKVQSDQHELRWKKELWLTDEALAKRISQMGGSRYTVRKFHTHVAPHANDVRVAHAISSDGTIRTFYSSKDVIEILSQKILNTSK